MHENNHVSTAAHFWDKQDQIGALELFSETILAKNNFIVWSNTKMSVWRGSGGAMSTINWQKFTGSRKPDSRGCAVPVHTTSGEINGIMQVSQPSISYHKQEAWLLSASLHFWYESDGPDLEGIWTSFRFWKLLYESNSSFLSSAVTLWMKGELD